MVAAQSLGPPFRVIAIVESAAAARRVVEMLSSLDAPRAVGLMLRDPGHDTAIVTTMAAALGGLSPLIHPIANGGVVRGIRRTHLPYAQSASAAALIAEGYGVGVSIHSLAEAGAIIGEVDYLIASPVFPTTSKPGHPGIGLAGLGAICAAASSPVFALGGIDAATAGACFRSGAYGIAAISAFDDPRRARELVAAVDEFTNQYTGRPDEGH